MDLVIKSMFFLLSANCMIFKKILLFIKKNKKTKKVFMITK